VKGMQIERVLVVLWMKPASTEDRVEEVWGLE